MYFYSVFASGITPTVRSKFAERNSLFSLQVSISVNDYNTGYDIMCGQYEVRIYYRATLC